MTNHHYENQLAQHINFACVQCQSKLHLTNFPRQTEFVLTCPCCKRKGRYNLHQLLDDALEHATRTGSLTELSAALQLGADVEVRVNWRGYEMPPAAVRRMATWLEERAVAVALWGAAGGVGGEVGACGGGG